MGSAEEGSALCGEKSKSLTFTDLGIPVAYICLYSDLNLYLEAQKRI